MKAGALGSLIQGWCPGVRKPWGPQFTAPTKETTGLEDHTKAGRAEGPPRAQRARGGRAVADGLCLSLTRALGAKTCEPL
jgi:hypothetical protein